jgi:hypothetical protein
MQQPAQDPLISLMLAQPKVDVSAPVHAIATFDPAQIRPGERSIYRVTFNALEESVAWPAQLTAQPKLTLEPGAHGQVLQMGGTSMVPITVFNSRAQPAGAGEYVVPEFTVMVYGRPVTVPAAKLVVATDAPANHPWPQLTLELSATNVFVGQPVSARVMLPNQGLTQVQLPGDGFLVDQGTIRQRLEATARKGASFTAFIYDAVLTPLNAGVLTIFAQGFTSGLRFSGPVVISGPATMLPQYTLLESEPVSFQVRALPREGELPGFTGIIGRLMVDPPQLEATVVRVGDPVKLTVMVRCDTPLGRVVAPPAPKSREWQVFAGELPQAIPVAQGGAATFSFTLIPMTEDATATPAIPFSCFDPAAGRYVDVSIPAMSITVKHGAAPADAAVVLAESGTKRDREREPALAPVVTTPGRAVASLRPVPLRGWFPLVQLAPATAFFGLWFWDRRRRYLEQHPEILLRRRARRALRRELRALRRAAEARDAGGFVHGAIRALRVGTAPHYPAEPRALVGSDVLAVLAGAGDPGRDARTREVVKRFFAVADAVDYAGNGHDAGELLALRPELERVLWALEEKL